MAKDTPKVKIYFILMQFSPKILLNNRFLADAQRLPSIAPPVWEILDLPLNIKATVHGDIEMT